jgi:hypothetical protein
MLSSVRDGFGATIPTEFGDGKTYVVFSRTPDASVTRTGSAASQTIVGSDFVDSLSGVGGDDVLIGNAIMTLDALRPR